MPVVAGRLVDLQNIHLELKCKIDETDGTYLAHNAETDANSLTPVFLRSALHSFFAIAL